MVMVFNTHDGQRERTPINEDTGQPAKRQESVFKQAKDFNGKAVVDILNGKKLGSLSDILFDPQSLRAVALLLTDTGSGGLGNLLNREQDVFPADRVEVWGIDAILVRGSEMINEMRTPEREGWVSLSDKLHGRTVISTDGDRVGQVEDVLIDSQGRLAGYQLSQVYIDGPLAESKQIPAGATSSMGKDVLIVDTARI